ncbi:MAG: hypothetical protein H6644_07610 [Caldilineaceae bacterium]|nr:hypothetical protein [Caldilineaceae bacterium]
MQFRPSQAQPRQAQPQRNRPRRGRAWTGLGLLLVGFFWWPAATGVAHAQTANDASDEIVYIDGVGYIRVYDRLHTGGGQIVNWHSEENDWRDFTLGDFNGDGDDEIAAVRTDDGVGRLVIFDPVIASGVVVPGQRVDDIPWKVLCDLVVEGTPDRLAAGEFDAGIPGDELVFGATTTANDQDGFGPYLVSILHRTGGTAQCPWSPMIDRREFSDSWTKIAAANLNHVGVDEVILLDDDESTLAVYTIANGMDDTTDRILNAESDSKKWNDIAPGNYQTNLDQLGTVRSAPLGLASMLIMQYRNVDDTWVDTYAQEFVPSPRAVFRADLDGNGDDEAFMLREVPTNINSPRIFMRNPGGSALPPFEQTLDNDNGFRTGAGGDVDGDGKDEIVIIRSLQMRLYLDPDSASDTTRYSYEGFATSTNGRSIQIGDLDKNGYIGRPYLQATPAALNSHLVEGEVGAPLAVAVTQPAGGRELDFTVAVEGEPNWLTVVPATGGTTPLTLTVTLDASLLFPGTYATELVLSTTSQDALVNTTRAAVNLTVTTGIFTTPSNVTVFSACAGDATDITVAVDVLGTTGTAFTAGIEAPNGVAPAWVTSAPETGSIPATLTVTIDPAQRPSSAPQSALLVASAGGDQLRVPIALYCVNAEVWLPVIFAE